MRSPRSYPSLNPSLWQKKLSDDFKTPEKHNFGILHSLNFKSQKQFYHSLHWYSPSCGLILWMRPYLCPWLACHMEKKGDGTKEGYDGSSLMIFVAIFLSNNSLHLVIFSKNNPKHHWSLFNLARRVSAFTSYR